MSQPVDRRAFIRRSTGAAVSISMAGPLSRQVLGANERIRLGVIGTGRQGLTNMKAFQKHGVEVTGLCDVYAPNLAKAVEAAGPGAKTCTDFRRLLDDREIDVVVNATPDHWHALPTIMACQAGKDVFVEKPLAVAVDEGKAMVAAARKHGRVVQVGLWQRSNAHFARAAQEIRQGLIGTVTFVRTWNYGNSAPEGIGNPPDSEPPAGLDWEMWLGPAPYRPYNSNRFGVGDRWSTFRYFYDYANGWIGDWGVHLVDIVQWTLGVPGPHTVSASGSRFVVRDNSDVPDTLQATFEYPGFLCVYENRLANANPLFGRSHGIELHGTDGTMLLDRTGFEVFPEKTKREDGTEVPRTVAMKMERTDEGLESHVADMLECMKTRRRPVCDIEEGQRSSATCLVGNIALRTGERIAFDPVAQELLHPSPAAARLFRRDYRAPWKLPV